VDGINGHAGKQEQMIHLMTLRSQSQHARHGPTTILWLKRRPEPTAGWKVGKPVETIRSRQAPGHSTFQSKEGWRGGGTVNTTRRVLIVLVLACGFLI
jgi:hypothetical protein